jgi:hypothetical protein
LVTPLLYTDQIKATGPIREFRRCGIASRRNFNEPLSGVIYSVMAVYSGGKRGKYYPTKIKDKTYAKICL